MRIWSEAKSCLRRAQLIKGPLIYFDGMSAMRFLVLSVSLLFAGLSWADSDPAKKGYEVNDANCAPVHLKTLPDDAARQELVSKCLRRGEFKSSPSKSW